MTNGQSDNEEVRQLKEKYLQRVAELDQEEAALQEQIELLQKMVVRISLAADGKNESLDQHLASLREMLRKTKGANSSALNDDINSALKEKLETIESYVRQLDDEEQGPITEHPWLSNLSELLTQLLEMDISKEHKKSLKSLSKQLKKRATELSEAPELMAKFASLQQQALVEQLQKLTDGGHSSSEAGSLLKRLFSGNSNREQSPETLSNSPSDSNDPSSNTNDTPTATSSSTPTTTPTEKHAPTDIDLADIDDSEHEAIYGHINASLKNLLEQLSVPENNLTVAKILRNKVEEGLESHEIGPTMDDVANLVVVAIRKGQTDFETFLQSIKERVQTLQTFLDKAFTDQAETSEAEEQLNQDIRDHLASLSGDVKSATDLDQLKLSVQGNLDNITNTLAGFMEHKSTRDSRLQQDLKEAQSRVAQMESELEQMKLQLIEERDRALTDPLTELPNRAAYNERLQIEHSRWERYKNPTSLAIADIDHFKNINDNYGHSAGDRVIKVIAQTLKDCLRKTDFIARVGGEEFVILMAETGLDAAAEGLEKARKTIASLNFHFRQKPITITMSFGVIDFRDGNTPDQLFDKADKALYQAKEAGRNRVIRFMD